MGYAPAPMTPKPFSEKDWKEYCRRKVVVTQIPSYFDWKCLKRIKDRWKVTIMARGEGERYLFSTEKEANEFAMLKKLEQ